MNKIQLDKYVLFYENCQVTKGYGRALLVDLQQYHFEFLDNKVYDLIRSSGANRKTLSDLLDTLSSEEQGIFKEYLHYLLAREYIFLCDAEDIDHFPPLSMEWDYPSEITNCLIDYTHTIPKHIYIKLLKELSGLGCEAIQIRDYEGLKDNDISILKLILQSVPMTMSYLLLRDTGMGPEYYKALLQQLPMVNEIIVHTAQEDYIYNPDRDQRLYMTVQELKDHSSCGIISTAYFNMTMEHYTESQQYNTCLNRKIGIDKDGNIKNCPSMQNSYGNIFKNTIADVLINPEFKRVWTLNKNQVNVCKICEFRHVCTDCRAFHEDDYNMNKPVKCNYDPLQMEWLR
jgi:SPASM domain peptide maturase of grasp-with-spasm system